MKIPKRVIASLLALSLTVSNFPTISLAAEKSEEAEAAKEISFSEETNVAEETDEEEIAEQPTEPEISVASTEVSATATEITGTCGDTATWSYDEANFKLIISGTGAMTEYTSASKTPWYSYVASIQSVEIQDGITTIGKYVFSGMTALDNITIADSVTSIGNYAFQKCSALSSILLPVGLTTIGNSTFSGCTGFTEIILPENVETIGSSAFTGCTSLVSVEITGSKLTSAEKAFNGAGSTTAGLMIKVTGALETLPAGIFYNSANVNEIQLNEGLISIGNNAFRNCTSLKAIEIPETVTTIGTYAFADCSVLTAIEIPSQVTEIGNYTFSGCTALADVQFPDSMTSIGSYVFKGCSSLSNITLPLGLTTIGSSTFSGCIGLTEIIIPENVETMGSSVFTGCTALVSAEITGSKLTSAEKAFSSAGSTTNDFVIKITGALETLPSGMFQSCANVDEIQLNDGLISIGNSAFRSCTSLTAIEIPETVTTIGTYVFADNDVLTAIEIPSQVTAISNYTFSGCTALTDIKLPNGIISIGSYAFKGCTALSSITLPVSLTTIGSSAFSGCTGLTEIIIPENVETMGSSAFTGCTSLVAVEIASSKLTSAEKTFNGAGKATNDFVIKITGALETLPAGMFQNGANVDEIQLNDGLITIGNNAFRSCTSLKAIEIPETVTTYGNYVFSDCSSLTAIVIPATAENIGNYLFNGCTALTDIQLSEGITSIGNYTFKGCTALTDIQLPESITSIGNYVFQNCSSLSSVTLPKGVVSIGNSVFSGCAALKTITIPENVETLGSSLFAGCTVLTEVDITSSKLATTDSPFADAGSALTNLVVKITGDLESLPQKIFYNANNLNTVELNDGLNEIGSSAFYGATSLKEIAIPESVTRINNSVFSGCSGLESITLPKNIIYLGGSVFLNCTSLSAVNWETDITVIPASTFSGCSALAEFQIPEQITEIGGSAFSKCTALTKITIPENVNTLGESVFYGCSALETVEIKTLNLISANRAFSGAGSENGFKVVLPDNMVTIPVQMFSGCSNLTQVNIPDTVTKIGYLAFDDTEKIEGMVTTEDGLTILQNWVIDYQSSNTTLTIPDGVIGIADNVFCRNAVDQNALTEITFPDSLLYIGEKAFYYCEGLTTLNNTDQVIWVGPYAFGYTAWIKEGEFASIAGVLFGYNGEATELTIPEGITRIEENAFASNTTITALIVPSYVESIENAFSGSAIKELHIENPDIQMNYLTLYGSNLESIYIAGKEDQTFLDMVEEYGPKIFPSTKVVNNILDSWYVGGDNSLNLATDGTALTSLVGRAIARKVIEEENITTIKEAYDWICRNVYYLSTGFHSNYAEGAFFQSGAYCQGVALAMKAFLDELNYPNIVLIGKCTGDYGTFSHAWNQVYTGGRWMNIDATDTEEGDYSTYMNDDYYISSGYYGMLYEWDQEEQLELQKAAFQAYEKRVTSEQPLTFTLQSDGTYWVTDCEHGTVKVEIPAVYEGVKVTGIGAEAFKNCVWLEEIVIPEGITTIGTEAFRNCLALKKVTLPSTVTTVSAEAFKACVFLKEVDLSQTQVTDIYSSVFMGCLNLAKIKLPVTVKSIANDCISPYIINSITGKNILTIYGYSDGKAETFALDMGLKFVSIGITPHTHTMSYIKESTAGCLYEGNIAYYHCAGCDKYYLDENGDEEIALSDTVIATLEHKYTNYVSNNDATCLNDGTKTAVCDNGCGTKDIVIDTGSALGHTEVIDKAVDPTCKDTGLTEGAHCSVCQVVLIAQEIIPVTDHVFTDYISNEDATCTEDGTKTATCDKGCGTKDTVADAGSAFGHTEVTDQAVAPTCTETGLTEGKHCSVCKEVLVAQEIISVTEHSWSEWSVVTEATYTKTGLERRNCTVCSHSETKEIPVVKATSISLNQTSLELIAREEMTLQVTCAPIAPAEGEITWISSNDTVATVDSNGKVTAVGGGTAVITAKVGGIEAACNVTVVAIFIPEAPENIEAVLSGDYNDVKLIWSASENATGYYVYYKKAAESSYSEAMDVTDTSYTFTDLEENVNYDFKVLAYYQYGDNIYFNKDKAATASARTLKTMSAPAVTKASATKIEVSWEEVSGRTGYQLSQSTSKTGTNIIVTTMNTSEKIAVTRNKAYYYKIRAYAVVGDEYIYSPWSVVTSYNLRYVAAQTTVKAALYGYDDVKLIWTKVTGANSYDVYYKKSIAASYTKVGSTTGTSYKKANLADGVKYTFKVVPTYKSSGTIITKGTAKTVSITTLKKLNTPKVTKYSSKKVKVTWNNIAGETGYQISRSTSKTGTNIVSTYATTTAKSKTITATKGKTYYYKVRAYKTVNGTKIYGPWSAVKSFKLN